MATVKTKFRMSSSELKEGTIFYQVVQNKEIRRIRTDYKLYLHEWDAENENIIFPLEVGEKRRCYLELLKKDMQKDKKRLGRVILCLNRLGNSYTAEEVVRRYFLSDDDHCFISFARNLVVQLRNIGKYCTADTYTTTVNSFARFLNGQDVFLDDMTSDLMAAYEVNLKSIGLCSNSISFYMRNLRAIYNRAVDKELTVQHYPFKRVYTGIDKTVKRAVPLSVIKRIRYMDLSFNPQMDYARDIFMFSFYMRGMSFVDMAFLKKKDLQNGILSYRRRKTNQQLHIKWEQPMQELIDKYDTTGTPYLLPIIKNDSKDERWQYKSEAHKINRNLRKVGELLGLTIPLTTYVARHGWASIAKSKNIPIATISEAMGHNSETTTRIYLDSLDTSIVDKANNLIINSL